jgi:DNA-binding transcriptional LysR family regulator
MRYFVAVAEEGSFTRAAERLWIAQPGLSQQILALERELDVRLFERLSRGVELTDAGRIFLDKARVALEAADDALSVARDAEAGLMGNLRLGLSWRARYDLAPDLQHAFGLRRPGVHVTVVEAQTDTLIRDVHDHKLDAAIVLAPEGFQPGLDRMIVNQGSVGVIVGAEHPLAAREVLTVDDLRGQVFMVSGDRGGETYDHQIKRALTWLGIEHRVLPGGYGFAMLGPVRAGEAVMFDGHPSLAAGAGLAWRPLDPAPTFRFDLIWLSAVRSGPLTAFIETCEQEVRRRGLSLADAPPYDATPLRAVPGASALAH